MEKIEIPFFKRENFEIKIDSLFLKTMQNVRMYEILAYKFDNPSTALHFQELFKNLTGEF